MKKIIVLLVALLLALCMSACKEKEGQNKIAKDKIQKVEKTAKEDNNNTNEEKKAEECTDTKMQADEESEQDVTLSQGNDTEIMNEAAASFAEYILDLEMREAKKYALAGSELYTKLDSFDVCSFVLTVFPVIPEKFPVEKYTPELNSLANRFMARCSYTIISSESINNEGNVFLVYTAPDTNKLLTIDAIELLRKSGLTQEIVMDYMYKVAEVSDAKEFLKKSITMSDADVEQLKIDFIDAILTDYKEVIFSEAAKEIDDTPLLNRNVELLMKKNIEKWEIHDIK